MLQEYPQNFIFLTPAEGRKGKGAGGVRGGGIVVVPVPELSKIWLSGAGEQLQWELLEWLS